MSRPWFGNGRQDVLAGTGVWERAAADGGGIAVLTVVESLTARIASAGRFRVLGGQVYVTVEGRDQPLNADAIAAFWRDSGGADRGGNGTPSPAELAEVARQVGQQVIAEHRRRAEEAAVADAAQAATGVAEHAARDAARVALQRRLAELDQAPAATGRHPWWRTTTDPTRP